MSVNQYVDYGCCNIVDGCRTMAYMSTVNHPLSQGACLVGSAMQPCSCCVTPDEDDLPVSGSFVSPVLDPAPWYNVNDPRSGHYLGAMIYDEWTESQPYVRETVATTAGARAKRAKLQRKEVLARFILMVDDACAIDFAKAWFLNQFICSTEGGGACELPSLHWHECYDTADCNDNQHSIRGFPRAAVTNLDWIEDEIDACMGIIAEVTFAAEYPWVYEVCPETVVEDLLIIAGDSACTICEDPCPTLPDPYENPCSPLTIVLPEVQLDSCYCQPPGIYKNCFKIDEDGRIGESTLEIVIDAGSSIMKNFRIKGWANPLGTEDPDYFRCVDPCIDIGVAGPLAPYSKMRIDGTTRDVTITRNNTTVSGRNWVESGDGSPFSWPDISCSGLFLCLEASAVENDDGTVHTAPDATISIYRYHRELR